MRVSVLIGVFLSLATTAAQAESCASLEQRVNDLIAQANNSSGICQAARISVELYQAAGDYNYYCISGGEAQAQEYYSARDQAQATANASCY